MTSLPNHQDFIQGVTPANLQKYPHGLGIVIGKIEKQTTSILDNDGVFHHFLDLLLLNDKEGLKDFFSSLGDDSNDGASQKQLTLLSNLYRIAAGYSAPRELGESSELSSEQLYNLSTDFFQSALTFLYDEVLSRDTHTYLKIAALNTISEYTQYILILFDKAQREREKIISHMNAEKRSIDSTESGIKKRIKSIILGKDYIEQLKKAVDTQMNPEISANSETLYKIAGKLRVIDSFLKSSGEPGIVFLDISSNQKSILERILK